MSTPVQHTDVAWDLEPLVTEVAPEGGAAGVDRLLDEAAEQATAFASTYQGKVAELDGAGLAAAIAALTEISDRIGRAASYASLKFAEDTTKPEHGALLAKVEERATAVQTALLFFDLEWTALDDGRAEELLGADGLERARHYLRTVRRYKAHQLSEPEERILAEKQTSSRGAWDRLFDELTSVIEVDVSDVVPSLSPDGAPVALDVALSQLTNPDRDVRRGVASAVTTALQPGLRTRAFIYNTLLQDKAVEDRLRSFGSWIASRNLSNEASDESVQALVDAVQEAYDVPQRWYRLKARILGLERLSDFDRMASITAADEAEFDWATSTDLVFSSFDAFAPEMGDVARRFVDEGWIDAPPRAGKRGGAFCAYTVPDHHPYVLLNWTSRRRDVLTLAHELGHGIHAYLARDRGPFEQTTPLTLAETASVFGETLVFDRLLAETTDPQARLGLLAEQIEGSIATIFRQTAMNRFEDAVHTARREEGELSVERFGELWHATQTAMLGDAVELTDGYRAWWSYVPHFIGTPGYVYAYAYGQLMALSVYGRYREEGPSFAPKYLELLATGGSKAPEDLVAIAGLDLTDPGFWRSGLALVREQLEQAEQAAADAGVVER
ncbi:M3 family oligoendopeptidase [Patulibacter brassicae]|jgi:oligoendopeptidase F|uniref:M3 family oligoendopeptidase n=1 Tax=Patulibacter brassicae TaxID=1705717 RepID=A0ABU4VI62_9ACTN|nr:M3 family oligoendopeptidase [Patulibacter brassicae]MDX8151463.1 M3 family oligoendopeptidase [Patulibacter brassicae]